MTGAFEESQLWCLECGFGWCQRGLDSCHAEMISFLVPGVRGRVRLAALEFSFYSAVYRSGAGQSVAVVKSSSASSRLSSSGKISRSLGRPAARLALIRPGRSRFRAYLSKAQGYRSVSSGVQCYRCERLGLGMKFSEGLSSTCQDGSKFGIYFGPRDRSHCAAAQLCCPAPDFIRPRGIDVLFGLRVQAVEQCSR